MRNLDSCRCWRCMLCPCKVRNKFLINFWNRTILCVYPVFRMCLAAYLIHSFIHSSMALQPFVGPWPLLQFRNYFYTDGRTPWTSDQPVTRTLTTHRITQHRINAHTDIHALSVIRTHDPSVRAGEDGSCLRPGGHCERHLTYLTIGYLNEPCTYK
jgi:hypothetical protein